MYDTRTRLFFFACLKDAAGAGAGLQAKLSQALWGPALSKNATDQSEILDLGSHNSLVCNVQHDMYTQFFSQKITPPYSPGSKM